MKKIGFRFLYLFLCLSIILTGCGPLSMQKIDLHPCRAGDFDAQCGTLSVFEDRALNSGRMIDISVAVIKARAEDPVSDPIFWLAGGPGGSAIEDVSYAMQILGDAN